MKYIFEIENVYNPHEDDVFIWYIKCNNTILLSGISGSWLEAYEEGSKEFKKLFKVEE